MTLQTVILWQSINIFVYNRALSREITQNYLAYKSVSCPFATLTTPQHPAEILQNELAAKFCPLFHDHYNTARGRMGGCTIYKDDQGLAQRQIRRQGAILTAYTHTAR